jgi:hypothetical protein
MVAWLHPASASLVPVARQQRDPGLFRNSLYLLEIVLSRMLAANSICHSAIISNPEQD